MEWCGHGKPSAWRRSNEIMATAMQNTPLRRLGKRVKRVGVEEVTMAKLLAN